MKLKISDMCDHDVKMLSNCPKNSESDCGIMYRAY